jgi:release factor glutamine methyltransferase
MAERRLATADVDSPGLDARLLIGHALNLDRAEMLSQSERELTINEITIIDQLIVRRCTHEPVARIFGQREFWSLNFGLNEATLDPRPDSETLVEVAVRYLRDMPSPRILDIGTGSGCLLLAILNEVRKATGLGIDIAPRAIDQAQINATKLWLADRVRFQVGNWLDHITEKFDAIISNPPYIPSGDIASLMPEVRDFDPRRALDGGEDGLDIYRLLLPLCAGLIKPTGFALFEIGQGQAEDVSTIFRDCGFKGLMRYQDLNGIERCIMGWRQ